ncbi:MAG: hypothetical protein A07HB70_00780 [uncultured archaeon A07HB70]|nr:MAG: hypothetical protein A07HB70_00780 [uncultured archaeon A07HB70]
MTDLPPPVDGAVDDTAEDAAVTPARLRELLAAHQRLVRETPGTGGVAGLIYEWHRAFGRDPVVARESDAIHLAVEPHVWDEYTDALGVEPAAATALRAVHAAAHVDVPGDDRDPMVVGRD